MCDHGFMPMLKVIKKFVTDEVSPLPWNGLMSAGDVCFNSLGLDVLGNIRRVVGKEHKNCQKKHDFCWQKLFLQMQLWKFVVMEII